MNCILKRHLNIQPLYHLEWVCAIMGTLSFIFWLFRWDIADTIMFFFLPFIEIANIGAIVSLIIASIINALSRGSNNFRQRFAPLIITTCMAALLVFFPFTTVWLSINYSLYHEERNLIVSQIIDGEIPISANAELPDGYKHLSKGGGEIQIFMDEYGNLSVFFYMFRGVLSNYSGYVYVSDNDIQRYIGRCCYDDDVNAIIKKQDFWYWCSFT